MDASAKDDAICEGFVEKRNTTRRIPIGPVWKRRYCALSSEGLRLHRSKAKHRARSFALRVVPLCHIKSVRTLDEKNAMRYFDVETEQGETISFRCHDDSTAWAAQIQIQLIQYKNRQDIMRYKQLINDMTPAEVAMENEHRLYQAEYCDDRRRENHATLRLLRNEQNACVPTTNQNLRTVILPNRRHKDMSGIGITVIPTTGGRIVVNRLLAKDVGQLRPGDEVVAANGVRVTDVQTLCDVVRNSSDDFVALAVHPRVSRFRVGPDADDPKRLLQEQQPSYRAENCNSKRKRIFKKDNGQPFVAKPNTRALIFNFA